MKNPDFLYFHSQQCQFTLFNSSLQRHICYNFQYFDQYIEIFWKNCSLALHTVDTYTDQAPNLDLKALDADPAKRYQSDRILIHSTAKLSDD